MSKINHAKSYFLILSYINLLFISVMAQPIFAEEDTKKSKEQENLDFQQRFEVITITARRTEESLQTTPIAVTALSDEGIEARGFQDVSEIAQIVPNLVFDGAAPISGNSATPSVFIRGIGQLDFTINADPGVGIYVDGVYVARSVGGIIDLLDLERVEVLRGPQGTLFGRNTIGGAIQLISKKPELNEVSGFLKGIYGSDNRSELQGAINAPISDNSAFKLTSLIKQRKGFVTNALGQDLGDDDSYSFRGQYRWWPNDDWEVNLAADFTRDKENGAANVALTGFVDGAMAYRFNTGANFGCGAPDANLSFLANGNLDTSTTAYADYLGYINANSNNCFSVNSLADNRNRTNSSTPALSQNDIFGLSATIESHFGNIQFKSITAYRSLDAKFQRDSDHTQFHIFDTINRQDQSQLSQEFNFSAKQDNFKWLTGLYYFDEEAQEDVNIILPAASRTILIRGIFDNAVENKNWALFGEATFDISDQFHITAGLRYTKEDKQYATNQIFGFTGDAPSPIYNPEGFDLVTMADYGGPVLVTLVNDPDAAISISETTTRLTAAYDVSDSLFTYATYSQGFKSGGFTPRYLAPTGLGNTEPSDDLRAIRYAPEFVEMYEIGAKINLGHHFKLNLATFMTDYKDIQVSASTPNSSGARVTANAAAASINGFEAEMIWLPLEDLIIEASLGVLDAKYDEFGSTVDFLCLPDCELARIPEKTASIGFIYHYQMSNGATLMPRMDWSYKSEVEGDANNAPQIKHPDQSIVNFSLVYEAPKQDWLITAGVSNLFDEEYIVSSNNNPRLSYSEVIYGRGTEAFLSVKRVFD